MNWTYNAPWARPGRVLGGGALVLTLALGACDTESLITLPDPDLITLPTVQDPANIEAVRNGAVFEFARAIAGPAGNNQTPGIIGMTAWLSDESWYSSTFTGPLDIDARDMDDTNGTVGTVYQWLHRARNLSDEVAELYVAQGAQNSGDYALMKNLAAFTYLYFAENWCSGVPFSAAPLGGQLVYAPGSTTAEMYAGAEQRFDAAIAAADAAGDADMEYLGILGKARVLQNEGDFAGAAALAAQIPDGWEYTIDFSANSAGQNNGVWYNINSEQRSSVATNEGTNGIDFFNRGTSGTPSLTDPDPVNTTDPRIPVDSGGTGIGTTIPLYRQFKYGTRGADVVLGSSIEARLIEAEAALSGGTSAAYLPILNDLRADSSIAPALTDPGTGDPRVLQLYEERARWLWLTAHRVGDLRRLIREYGFTEDEVFPVGAPVWDPTGTYGDDVNFIIPDEEENNPEYSGSCIDRSA